MSINSKFSSIYRTQENKTNIIGEAGDFNIEYGVCKGLSI